MAASATIAARMHPLILSWLSNGITPIAGGLKPICAGSMSLINRTIILRAPISKFPAARERCHGFRSPRQHNGIRSAVTAANARIPHSGSSVSCVESATTAMSRRNALHSAHACTFGQLPCVKTCISLLLAVFEG
jgi:hypothetical protein